MIEWDEVSPDELKRFVLQGYTGSAAVIYELERRLHRLDRAEELLKEATEPMSDPCRYDHHGYCQSHFLHDEPCPYSEAKEFLAKSH